MIGQENAKVLDWKYAYLPIIVLWITLAAVLGLPKYSLFSSCIQTLTLIFLTYMGHVLLHTVTVEHPLFIFNTHMFLHHSKEVIVDKRIELFVEAIGDFWCFFSLIVFQYVYNLDIYSTSIILFSGVLYIITHIFDYSIYGNEKHGLHHKYLFCNYEPEFMDSLFGTRCRPEEDYTDMSIEFPHAILAFIVIGTLKLIFSLD